MSIVLPKKGAAKESAPISSSAFTGDRFGLHETYKKKNSVSGKCDLKTVFNGVHQEVYAYILSGGKVSFYVDAA